MKTKHQRRTKIRVEFKLTPAQLSYYTKVARSWGFRKVSSYASWWLQNQVDINHEINTTAGKDQFNP